MSSVSKLLSGPFFQDGASADSTAPSTHLFQHSHSDIKEKPDVFVYSCAFTSTLPPTQMFLQNK